MSVIHKTSTGAEAAENSQLHAAIHAIKSGDAPGLESLLERVPGLIHEREANGYTLLHHAAGCDTVNVPNRVRILGILLNAGAEVDAQLAGGETALHFAAQCGHVEVTDALINAGASIRRLGSGDGGTPLVHALFYGHEQTAELLARHGIVPANLRVAAGLGRLDLMQGFFNADGSLKSEAGANRGFQRPHEGFAAMPNSNDRYEILYDAFRYACINNKVEAADFLLQHGVNINDKSHVGTTALHLAAYFGKKASVEFLLNRGANRNIRDDKYQGTPLGWAQHAKRDDMVEILSKDNPDDLASLSAALKDIDPQKLPHGLDQYRRFGPKTVRAILAVRDLVVHSADLSEVNFRIGITSDPRTQEARDRKVGSVKFQVIFESSDLNEARTVEADVRLNFLWHFPGRCLNKGDYRDANLKLGSSASVYVACFPKSASAVLGKDQRL